MEPVREQKLHIKKGNRQVPEREKQVRAVNLDQLPHNSNIKKTAEQSVRTDHQLIHRLMSTHKPLPSSERDKLCFQR
jgi:hypothetical protein